MIERHVETNLSHRLTLYPIVAIIGPRHSGKTTLARKHQGKRSYINLDTHDTRQRITQDPRGFLDSCPNGAIIDEVQRAPDLLSYLQVYVDEWLFQDKASAMGRFIVTSSHQLPQHPNINQSLAGRASFLPLLPLSLAEAQDTLSVDERLIQGLLPGTPDGQEALASFHHDCITRYLEHDIRATLHVQDPARFHQLMVRLMMRSGGLLNLQNLSNEVALSATTIKRWLSLLEASYLVFILRPYPSNIGKRLNKTPKVYPMDVGLACSLLGITEPAMAGRDRLRGSLFESLVVIDILKSFVHHGQRPNLSFLSRSGLEVDLLIERRDGLFPIEIKSAKTFHPEMLNNLKKLHQIMPERLMHPGCLIYAGETSHAIQGFDLIHYRDAQNYLAQKGLLQVP